MRRVGLRGYSHVHGRLLHAIRHPFDPKCSLSRGRSSRDISTNTQFYLPWHGQLIPSNTYRPIVRWPPGAAMRKSFFTRRAELSTAKANVPPASSIDLIRTRQGLDIDHLTTEDVVLYQRQAEIEERDAWQRQVDDSPAHEDYTPATTWAGLEMVGGETEWDNGKEFNSFLPTIKLSSPEEITVAIYRALIETFTLLGAGRPSRLARNYRVSSLLNETSDVRIVVVESDDEVGGSCVKLEYPDPSIEEIILDRVAGKLQESTPALKASDLVEGVDDTPVPADLGEQMHTPETLRLQIARWGHSWHNISLEDPKIKLAVVKRFIKITGITIPDPVIHRSTTISALLNELIKPTIHKTLFESLSGRPDIMDLNNIQLFDRRHTPVDKEQALGRWKVIEKELKARDLPLLGDR